MICFHTRPCQCLLKESRSARKALRLFASLQLAYRRITTAAARHTTCTASRVACCVSSPSTLAAARHATCAASRVACCTSSPSTLPSACGGRLWDLRFQVQPIIPSLHKLRDHELNHVALEMPEAELHSGEVRVALLTSLRVEPKEVRGILRKVMMHVLLTPVVSMSFRVEAVQDVMHLWVRKHLRHA